MQGLEVPVLPAGGPWPRPLLGRAEFTLGVTGAVTGADAAVLLDGRPVTARARR